jgi:hypothetical protein
MRLLLLLDRLYIRMRDLSGRRSLRFAELLLTPATQRYAGVDVDARKAMFGEALLAHVPLAQHIRRILDERASHKAPRAPFSRRTGGVHERGFRAVNAQARYQLGPICRDIYLLRGQ